MLARRLLAIAVLSALLAVIGDLSGSGLRWGEAANGPLLPDLWVWDAQGAVWIGNGVFNHDGTDQTETRTVLPNVAAVYRLRVENQDTQQAASFVVKGAAGDASWTVRYFDAPTGGNDVTADVTGSGWNTASIPAGGTMEFRAEVTPDSSVAGGAVRTVLVNAYPVGVSDDWDTVRLDTTCANVYRPDALIKNQADAAFLGGNIYNNTGAGQTKKQYTGGGSKAVFLIKAENDGNTSERLYIGSPGATVQSLADWNIAFFDSATGGQNITTSVLGTGWRTGNLARGTSITVRLEITPGAAVPPGEVCELPVRVWSENSPAQVDVVKAQVEGLGYARPDLMIRVPRETSYDGDNIYNTTGEGQSRAWEAVTNGRVGYLLLLENDGRIPDTFVLSSPGIELANATWQVVVRHGHGRGGADITEDVFGATGWRTPVLQPGETLPIEIDVQPLPEAPDGELCSVLLQATSVADPSRVDAALTETTHRQMLGPDVMIRNEADPSFVGEDVINDTGEDQTSVQIVQGGEKATYIVRIENVGNANEQFLVTSPGISLAEVTQDGWTVAIYDAPQGGRDITAAVFATGWWTRTLAPHELVELRVEITADYVVPGGQACDVMVMASSYYAPEKRDAVVARAQTALALQPDLMLRGAGDADYVGQHTYDETGQSQTVTQTLQQGQTATYDLRLVNDGNAPDSFLLFSPGVTVAEITQHGWTVRVFDAPEGGADVTEEVFGDGLLTEELEPGAALDYRVEVEPGPNTPGDQVSMLLLAGISLGDLTRMDAVLAATGLAAVVRPDAQIQGPADSSYLGDDVYNTTAEDQTASGNISASQVATYRVKLENDGNVPDRFVVTSPGVQVAAVGQDGWIVAVFDAPSGGADITDQVMGQGWVSPTLNPGGTAELRIQVSADPTIIGDQVARLALTITSTRDPQLADTVQAEIAHWVARRPDLLVRRASDPDFLGGDIYNDTGISQQVSQLVRADQAAVYEVKVQNDSLAPDAIRVSSAGVTIAAVTQQGWTVAIFDATIDGADITEQVLGAGWISPELQAGEAVTLRVQVTPNRQVPGQQSCQLAFTGSSIADSAQTDTVVTETITILGRQPDMLIKAPADDSFIGEDLYDSAGGQQVRQQGMPPGDTAVFILRLQNDGNVPDSFEVTADAAALPPGWSARFFDAAADGADVTADVTGEGWQVGPLDPGQTRDFRLQLTADDTVGGNTICQVIVVGTSVADPGKADGVRAMVTTTAARQPDLLIRNAGEETFAGDGTYNTTGDLQAKAQAVGVGQTAVYQVVLENDGNSTDQFILTATQVDTANGAQGAWRVVFFDSLEGGNDITAQVTGSGWRTADIPAAGTVQLRMEVTPGPEVPMDAARQVLLKAVSARDSWKTDAVRATTTRTVRSQPDLVISTQAAGTVGDGIYNASGDGQSRSLIVDNQETATYAIALQNDGDSTDRFRLSLTTVTTGAVSEDDWIIAVYDAATGGSDIATEVRAGTWTSPPLAPGGAISLRLEVTPGPTVAGFATQALRLTANSVSNAAQTDAVRAETTKAGRQPDLLIRRAADIEYLGDDLYNATGDGQTASHAVNLTILARSLVKVENDGNVPDEFTLRVQLLNVAPQAVSSSGWFAAVYDAAQGGTDITAQATGLGWSTGPLAPGASRELRVDVVAEGAAAATNDLVVKLSAASVADPARTDTVQTTVHLTGPVPFSHAFDAGLWLAGVPAVPAAGRSTQEILGTTQAAIWDITVGAYSLLSDIPFALEPGRGFWVRYDTPHVVTFNGFPASAPVTRQLATGWNLLANPFETTLSWATVETTGETAPYAWVWDHAAHSYALVWPVPGTGWRDSIAPWEGFWLLSNESCEAHLDVTGTAQTPHKGAVAWALRLAAQAAGAVDYDNYVGVAKVARGLTAANPPTPHGGYVDLYIPTADGGRQAVDLVTSGKATSWDLVVETNLPHADVRVTLPDLSPVPAEMAVFLTDLETGKVLNMRTTRSYTFPSGAEGGLRRLRLEVKPHRAATLAITSAAATPVGRGVQLVYTLSAPADVQIEILNVAGRKVAELQAGGMAAGAHTAVWNGRNTHGAQVPSGRYLISLTCRAGDGTQTSRVIPALVK